MNLEKRKKWNYILVFLMCVSLTFCEPDLRVITSLKYSQFYIQPTVVNGTPASKGQLPYLVSIKEPARRLGRGRTVWVNICGGSILDQKRVLTAAHCFEARNFFYAKNPQILRIVAGNLRNDVTHSGETETNIMNQWRTIKSVIIHKNFYFPDNDIAIAVVNNEWKFIRNVNYVIPASINNDYIKPCVSAGFGRVGHGLRDNVSPKLLVAKINVIPQSRCSKLWEMNMNSFICTDSSFTDVARGDSGGPLVCKETLDPHEMPGRDLLVGIVSGKNFDKTTIYTRVSAYRDWIENNNGERADIHLYMVLITVVMSIYHLFFL